MEQISKRTPEPFLPAFHSSSTSLTPPSPQSVLRSASEEVEYLPAQHVTGERGLQADAGMPGVGMPRHLPCNDQLVRV